MFSTGHLPVIAENPISTLIRLKDNFTTVPFTCEADGAISYYWEKQHDDIPLKHSGNYSAILESIFFVKLVKILRKFLKKVHKTLHAIFKE